MAATAAREASRKPGRLQNYLMGAAAIWKGTFISSRVGDGLAYSSRSGTSTDVFLGVAFESKLSTDTSVRVEKTGSYVFLIASDAQTDIGAAVYASDNQTVTKTSTNNQLVGYIQEIIDATHVRVRIDLAVR